MWKMRKLASFAKQTPIPRTKTEPLSAVHVRAVVLPKKEVRNALIVWRGNTKKPRALKRFVLIVHQVTTRTHQTCKRASSARLDMRNLLRNKRRALNAAPVNFKMLLVRFVANRVSIRRTLVAKEETAVASTAQSVGRPKTAVRNVSRAVRVRLALGV